MNNLVIMRNCFSEKLDFWDSFEYFLELFLLEWQLNSFARDPKKSQDFAKIFTSKMDHSFPWYF